MFHNLGGNGSHQIMQEISKFDQKINVTPNGMKKYIWLYARRELSFY